MALGVHVNILEEVLLLDQAVALIVGLMVTGLETAKLGTGRTNVIAVVKEVISKETAKIVPRMSDVDGVIHDPHPLAAVGAEVGATAEAVVTVGPGLLHPEGMGAVLNVMTGDQGVLDTAGARSQGGAHLRLRLESAACHLMVAGARKIAGALHLKNVGKLSATGQIMVRARGGRTAGAP